MTHGLRALTHRSAGDRDIAEEVEHYLEQTTAAHVARGLSPEEALRAARREMNGVTLVKEQVREYGWENWVETLIADVRYGMRSLRAAPGFTAVTVITLALGVGAATAILSAVNPILFAPLPYPHPGRIAMILEVYDEGARNSGTFGMFRELAGRNRSFEALAVLRPWQPTATGTAAPERFEGQRVSASYFHVLGVSPMVGRDFEPSEDRLHGPNVVILSEALWRRRFAGDRAVVGRQIALDESPYTVVGVMPSDFENVLAPAAALWTPLQYDNSLPAQGREWGHHLRTVGRLQPGVTVDQATREINALGRSVLRERRPETYDPDTRFAVTSLHDELTRGVRPALLAILGAVMLVLVIACVNVTNLLLGRGVHRRGEFALRAALGAGRSRLVRQLLTEGVLLAAMGGVVGVAVAMFGVTELAALSPPGLPRSGAIRADAALFAFGLGITTFVGLAFGIVPALQAARNDPNQALLHSSQRTAGGNRRTRNALVVAEVALALVLLVSSGLLLRSLERLFAVPVGFDSSGLLSLQVQAVGRRFEEDAATHRFFDQAIDAARRVPGVTNAALTSQLPMSGDRDEYGAQFEASSTRPAETRAVFRYAVSPGYLETLRLPLRSGRFLDERDGSDAPLSAVLSESLARSRFHGEDPIGRRLRLGPAGPYTIVGVVGDVKQMSLALNESDAVYTSTAQWPFPDRVMSLVVRAGGNAAALAPAVRQAVWSVDKDQPVVRIAAMADLLASSAAERRFVLILFAAFAFVALALAAAGTYGVLSGGVTERLREIGVRSALGASRGDILALVVRQGMTLTALGTSIGLIGAVGASKAIVSLLFGVSWLDPLTYGGVIILLLSVSAIACAVPAWRAARVDPVITLRTE